MKAFQTIVVGAGIEGSATAYSLAKKGKRTLLLDQFPLPHSRGSSHGASRICRKAYEQAIYTEMMIEGYKLWEQLQLDTGTELFLKTGLLRVAPKSGGEVQYQAAIMTKHNLPFQSLSATQIKKKYGKELNLSDDYLGLFDPDGGVLKADKCVNAFQKEFQRLGGTIQDNKPVVEIVPGSSVRVKTTNDNYDADSVVLCLGPWSGRFLKLLGLNLPLRPQVVKACYWNCSDPNAFGAASGFPCYIVTDGDGGHFYGLPALEYPGMFKFCNHVGEDVDPDLRDTVTGAAQIAQIKTYVRNHFPLLHPEPVVIESCFYTWTPDSNFILDTHPRHRNIVIGAGFSGHGFKLAPVVGRILSQLATNSVDMDYDMTLFKINRFSSTQSAKL